MESQGRIRPEAKKPEIYGLDFYTWCFWELNTTRNQMAPISFLNIHKFAKILNIHDFDEFLYLIRRMDTVYLDNAEKKRNASNKAN